MDPTQSTYYSFVCVAPYFNVPARCNIYCPGNATYDNTTNNIVNWGVNLYPRMREDAGLVGDDGNPGGTGHTAYHFYLSYLDRTVDINPAKDGKVINGGAGQNDLTFDVYGGSDGTQLLQTGVKDFYQSVNYGTHLKITNIQCPTGYHAKQETYEYNITSDRTGNDAIKAPDITINHYNVVYNANVPNNDMTTKFKVSGKTDTLENCTYGVENTISECGYTLPGYTFKCWNTSADGNGTTYNPGDTFTALAEADGANVQLYAQWTRNDYTITFDLNGGSGDAPNQTVAYGENVSLPMDEFSKEGKTFIGWSLTANDIGSAVQSLRSGFHMSICTRQRQNTLTLRRI